MLKNFFLFSDAGKLTTASVSCTGIVICLSFWPFPFCFGDGGFIEIHKDFVDALMSPSVVIHPFVNFSRLSK